MKSRKLTLRRSHKSVWCSLFVSVCCYHLMDYVNCLDTIKNNDFTKDSNLDISTSNDSVLTVDNIAKTIISEENVLLSPIDNPNTDEIVLTFGGSSNDENQHLDRLWGSSGTSSPTSTVPLTTETETSDDRQTKAGESNEETFGEAIQHQRRWGSSQQQATLPKTGKTSDMQIVPPEGFAITARVYIDADDKLAHFDGMEETNEKNNSTIRRNSVVLPYYDCGVSGATTAALLVKQIYFRHALSSPTTVYIDQSSTDSKLVLYPVLAIALSAMTVELDSGEHMDFVAGDAILFEDTIRPGHLLTVSKESKNLTVLLITLPNKHHHIGKQYLSIKAALTAHPHKATPCRISKSDDNNSDETKKFDFKIGDPKFEKNITSSNTLLLTPTDDINSAHSIFSDTGRRIRLALLATIAFSLSTLMADFLGRTAPLWLAVGVGGTCFVLGSTYAITMFSDFIYATITLWIERRKLDNQRNESTLTTGRQSY